jgi:hypothetical protein
MKSMIQIYKNYFRVVHQRIYSTEISRMSYILKKQILNVSEERFLRISSKSIANFETKTPFLYSMASYSFHCTVGTMQCLTQSMLLP